MANKEPADLRDDRVVRATYLHLLMDWDGNDLTRVYEPISQQIGYIFCFVLLLICCYVMWKKIQKAREKSKQQLVPYRVVKPPSSLVSAMDAQNGEAVKKKRVCAVVGGTGFAGSHVVDELVKRNEYHVYVLGRKFRPERTNPDADCLIQVDLLDYDGLVSAFQGVDSVINAAAVLPSAFTSADDVWHKNKVGFDNLLRAAKEAGVKNLVHLSGISPQGKTKSLLMKSFIHAFYASESEILKANDTSGIKTCALRPAHLVGLNSPFLDPLFSGKMTSSPMPDVMPCSFMPVEYAARALVNAERKLASEHSEDVAGKSFTLHGEMMSWKTFLTLSTWPKKISEMPKWQVMWAAKINVFLAKVFGWAPFGAETIPDMMEFLYLKLEDMGEPQRAAVYKVLEVGPPAPPMEEYIKELVERYNAREENRKEK